MKKEQVKILVGASAVTGVLLAGAGVGNMIFTYGKKKSETNPFIGGILKSIGNVTFIGCSSCLFVLPFVTLEEYIKED